MTSSLFYVKSYREYLWDFINMIKLSSRNISGVTKNQKIVAKGLFFNDKSKKEILLLKNKHGYWDLPGGHLEFGETPQECLLREIKEEIGLRAEVLKLLSIQTVVLEDHIKLESSHYISLIFECKISPSVLNNFSFHDDEIEGCKWFAVDLILKDRKMKILNFTKDLLINDKKIIAKKYFMKTGEINSYKEIKYK